MRRNKCLRIDAAAAFPKTTPVRQRQSLPFLGPTIESGVRSRAANRHRSSCLSMSIRSSLPSPADDRGGPSRILQSARILAELTVHKPSAALRAETADRDHTARSEEHTSE